jgi:hypothetical protein
MPEKDTIFSSKMKSTGVFSFSDFYEFCYNWLVDETELDVAEKKYKEKIIGDSKGIEIEWTGTRKVTDYFKFEVDISFRVIGLSNIEVVQNGKKIKTNKGAVEVKVKGLLVRDYQGKFEKTAIQKFMRGIYEKWVIPSRVEEYEDKLAADCDEFLSQMKAWLDLEGKR